MKKFKLKWRYSYIYNLLTSTYIVCYTNINHRIWLRQCPLWNFSKKFDAYTVNWTSPRTYERKLFDGFKVQSIRLLRNKIYILDKIFQKKNYELNPNENIHELKIKKFYSSTLSIKYINKINEESICTFGLSVTHST